MTKEFFDLLDAAEQLREAQRTYMANRGNDELGKAVAVAAEKSRYRYCFCSKRIIGNRPIK